MNYICEYDEGYTKSEAEEIGFCERCRIATCEKSKVTNRTDLKEKLIAALAKELGSSMSRPERIRKVVERIL